MEENNLFSKPQHGFETGRSCSTQLLELMEELTEILDSNEECGHDLFRFQQGV